MFFKLTFTNRKGAKRDLASFEISSENQRYNGLAFLSKFRQCSFMQHNLNLLVYSYMDLELYIFNFSLIACRLFKSTKNKRKSTNKQLASNFESLKNNSQRKILTTQNEKPRKNTLNDDELYEEPKAQKLFTEDNVKRYKFIGISFPSY